MKFAGFSLAPDFKTKSDKMFNKAQNAIDKKCIEVLEDYTPVAMDKYRNHGKMSRSHRQERPGVIINPEPKARREYYTNKGFSGGKRGKFWLERMKLDRRGEILNAAKEAVK
jgi:hypothetical protein